MRIRSTSDGSAASTTRAKVPALLGFGERDSAGLLFGGGGPERAVVMTALGGGSRLVVGAAVLDPQGGPRGGVDGVVALSRPSRLLSVRFESGGSACASVSASL